jgi:hypothetical protein
LNRTNADKTQQITVYSNTVDNNSNNNAMILPVPYPESIKFINLSNYKNIFSDCQSVFIKPQLLSWSKNATLSYSVDKSAKLEVFNVGSYKVSLAKNLSDLKRVDESVFELSSGCEEVLSKTYRENYWGFIICKLSKGQEEYHPFAYSHNILNNKVFIPTKHYHQHQNNFSMAKYDSFNIDSSPMFNYNVAYNNTVADKIADDWDHDIYLYNVGPSNGNLNGVQNTNNEKWTGENNLRLEKINFNLSNLNRFEKLSINGRQPNIDLEIPVY